MAFIYESTGRQPYWSDIKNIISVEVSNAECLSAMKAALSILYALPKQLFVEYIINKEFISVVRACFSLPRSDARFEMISELSKILLRGWLLLGNEITVEGFSAVDCISDARILKDDFEDFVVESFQAFCDGLVGRPHSAEPSKFLEDSVPSTMSCASALCALFCVHNALVNKAWSNFFRSGVEVPVLSPRFSFLFEDIHITNPYCLTRLISVVLRSLIMDINVILTRWESRPSISDDFTLLINHVFIAIIDGSPEWIQSDILLLLKDSSKYSLFKDPISQFLPDSSQSRTNDTPFNLTTGVENWVVMKLIPKVMCINRPSFELIESVVCLTIGSNHLQLHHKVNEM